MSHRASPRELLFQTAARLFYRHGYRATGVDTIAAESGIGKMTLYRHYPSKDDLILAYLRDSDGEFWGNFEQITKAAPDAREKLLAFFAALQEYVLSPACHGCPFLNVASEYPQSDHVGHRVAVEHKQAVRARLSATGNGSRRAPAGRSRRFPGSADGWSLHGSTRLRRLTRQSGCEPG